MSELRALGRWMEAARGVLSASSGPQMTRALEDLRAAHESYEREANMQKEFTLKTNPSKGICRIEGCDHRTHARGLCGPHYNQAARACILDEVGAPIVREAATASTEPAAAEQSAVAASTPSPEAQPPQPGAPRPTGASLTKNKKKILDSIPWDSVLEFLDTLAEAGWEKDAALDLASGLLDKALPLDTLVAGAAGDALEAIDGPVLRAALGLLWNLAQNQVGREARKARAAKAA